jgi:hypothetical protein
MIVASPCNEFQVTDEDWRHPQCRMPEYAASGVADVGTTVFSVILFQRNLAKYRY